MCLFCLTRVLDQPVKIRGKHIILKQSLHLFHQSNKVIRVKTVVGIYRLAVLFLILLISFPVGVHIRDLFGILRIFLPRIHCLLLQRITNLDVSLLIDIIPIKILRICHSFKQPVIQETIFHCQIGNLNILGKPRNVLFRHSLKTGIPPLQNRFFRRNVHTFFKQIVVGSFQ